jgi:putative colanic acid biosynthesis UDP-glucose lipid carrier transferase
MERALAEQSRLLRPGRSASAASTIEQPSIFAIRSLLRPVAAVACLLGCLLFWGESLYGPYFLLAVLTFLFAADLLDVAKVAGADGRYSGIGSLLDILVRWLLVVALIWLLFRLSQLADRFQFRVIASWALVTPVVLWLGESAAHLALTRNGANLRLRKGVILGLTDLGLKLEEKLNGDRALGTEVVGYFEDRACQRLPAEGVARVLGKPTDMPAFIERNDISVVYVTLPLTRHPRILDLLNALRDTTVSIYFVPDLFIFDLVQARFEIVGGIPILAVCESPFFGASSIAKRISDLAIASALLLMASPLMLAVAAGVRLSSPGPVIFRQKRYGLDGREILIYKFRSMTVTEDGHREYRQVTPGDARLTRFGAFIRRFSLDELPQLFNVLEGSLSIVGPRPHAIAVNEQYRRLIPGYMRRHKVKPGITGWAQINGYRGGDDLDSMRKRVEFDMDYLRHWSLALDLSIVLRTAGLVWRDRQAY